MATTTKTDRARRRPTPARESAVKRVSVFLDDATTRRLKVAAARRGLTLSALLTEWINAEEGRDG